MAKRNTDMDARNVARTLKLVAILQDANIQNEDGGKWLNFNNQGRDALDFATIGRRTLHAMMVQAYEAGKAAFTEE